MTFDEIVQKYGVRSNLTMSDVMKALDKLEKEYPKHYWL